MSRESEILVVLKGIIIALTIRLEHYLIISNVFQSHKEESKYQSFTSLFNFIGPSVMSLFKELNLNLYKYEK